MHWEAQNDPQTFQRGRIHQYTAYWPTLGPFGHPMGFQKGPCCPKASPTGRKASERPRAPWLCPKHHGTPCLDVIYWYFASHPIFDEENPCNYTLNAEIGKSLNPFIEVKKGWPELTTISTSLLCPHPIELHCCKNAKISEWWWKW